jgi:hypothetical protein
MILLCPEPSFSIKSDAMKEQEPGLSVQAPVLS